MQYKNCFRPTGFIASSNESEKLAHCNNDEAVLKSYLGVEFDFDRYVDVDTFLETRVKAKEINETLEEHAIQEKSIIYC